VMLHRVIKARSAGVELRANIPDVEPAICLLSKQTASGCPSNMVRGPL
jgi:hypothetical protein